MQLLSANAVPDDDLDPAIPGRVSAPQNEGHQNTRLSRQRKRFQSFEEVKVKIQHRQTCRMELDLAYILELSTRAGVRRHRGWHAGQRREQATVYLGEAELHHCPQGV